MTVELTISNILINLINAYLVPIILPIFTTILNRDTQANNSNQTGRVLLIKHKNGKIVRTTNYQASNPIREQLPSAYFANFVWAVVYMYGERFLNPYIIFYYTLIVLCLLLIAFTSRNYDETIKNKLILWVGTFVLVSTAIIIFGPLLFPKVFIKDAQIWTIFKSKK